MKINKYRTEISIFLICGLLIFFSPNLIAQKQFLSDVSYKNNLSKQKKLTSQKLPQIRKDDNVTETTELILEYFFSTNTTKKAKEITAQLQSFGYKAEFKKNSKNPNLYIVTGWTIKMKMSDKLILDWTKVMCELGYEFDCSFDGWKTSLK